jgi:hypothetical protein
MGISKFQILFNILPQFFGIGSCCEQAMAGMSACPYMRQNQRTYPFQMTF